jgi:hypothetical protein
LFYGVGIMQTDQRASLRKLLHTHQRHRICDAPDAPAQLGRLVMS